MRKIIGGVFLILGIIILGFSVLMTFVAMSIYKDLGISGNGPEIIYYFIIGSGVIIALGGIIILRFDGISRFLKNQADRIKIAKKEKETKKKNEKRESAILQGNRISQKSNELEKNELVSFMKQTVEKEKAASIDHLIEYKKHIQLYRHNGKNFFNTFRKAIGTIMFFGTLISIPFTAEPLFGGGSSANNPMTNILYLFIITAIFFTGAGLMSTANGAAHIAKVTAFAIDEFKQIYYIKYPRTVSEEIPRTTGGAHFIKLYSSVKTTSRFTDLERERSDNINRENFAEEVEKAVNHQEAALQGAEVILMREPVIKKRYFRYTLIQYKAENGEVKEADLFNSNEGYENIIKCLKRYLR